MKKLLFWKINVFLLPLLFAGMIACSSPFKKIPEEEVNKEVKEDAVEFAKTIMTQWKQGEVYTFTNENATPQMVDAFTAAMQMQASQQIAGMFGSYNSLSYADAWRIEEAPDLTIYRMKGDFAGGPAEVRVATSKEGKIAGFWVKPWKDELTN